MQQSSAVAIKVPLKDILARASQRPAGYIDEVKASGVIDGEFLLVEVYRWKELREKYAPGEPIQIPIPELSLKERGLGDWLARMLHRLGFRQRPGCGCAARQAWLNRFGFAVSAFLKSAFDKLRRSR